MTQIRVPSYGSVSCAEINFITLESEHVSLIAHHSLITQICMIKSKSHDHHATLVTPTEPSSADSTAVTKLRTRDDINSCISF